MFASPGLDRFLVQLTCEDTGHADVTLIQNWPALLEENPPP